MSTPAPPERLLAFHPIVLGDQVIVCDGSQVVAYQPQRSAGGFGRNGCPADQARLEIPPRERDARSASDPEFVGNSSLYAHGDRPPDLRPDGDDRLRPGIREWAG